jgi:hypothetical protein
LLLLLSPWKKINCYCSDDNDKKAHVTVESIIIGKGEEEPQIIHHSQERAAPRCRVVHRHVVTLAC